MSTTIDQKVVEMRFDNRDFERNTRESMSTLDKLKQKLNLSGASKGLDEVSKSAKNVDMSGLSNGLSTVQSRFSALEVVGVTALMNITNSAVNAGKQIIHSLTIAPVSDGFKEYEMTLNSVQTTMAGTGKTAEEVEKELKKLDEYADKTVYSTADMLNNLPKFTNAGVELESATTAMIGIANATALAGGDASKASIAFYNLGQAIGTGYLTRMDYNSINNAGIATMEWKQQMVDAALAFGTLKDAGNGYYQAGNKVLTMQQLFIDGLQEQWATTDVMMTVFEAYGDQTTDIGNKAYAAAQDIKTYSMMMDSLKATAGTGWKDTWQTIFGGLEPAKKFWTSLTNFISNIITSVADFRNKLLGDALGKKLNPFGDLFDKIKKSGIAKEIDGITRSLDEYQKMVTRIWRGDFNNVGDNPDRFDLLRKQGWDPNVLQTLVNKGYKYKLTMEDVAKAEKKYGIQAKETQTIEEMTVEDRNELLKQLAKMSDAQLRAAGYTEEQIEALAELRKYCKMTGLSVGEFIDNLDDLDGRWLLINSFKNIGQGLVTVFKSMKEAWVETIGVITGDHLFKAIAGFHKFTTYLRVGDRAAQNLKDTFKGVFSILDIVFTIIGGPIKIGIKLFGQLLKALDVSAAGILEFTGGVGRAISGFHDWLEEIFDFTAVFEFLAPYIKSAAFAVRDWIKSLGKTDAVKNFVSFILKAKDAIVEWFKGIKDADNIPKYIFEGLTKGLKDGVKGVVDFVVEIGTKILDGIREVLGIHSPSTEFYEIGVNIIQGLFNGIKETIGMIYELFTSFGGKLISMVKNLDIGSIFTVAVSAGGIYGFIQLAEAISALAGPFDRIDDILYQVEKVVKSFRGVLRSVKFYIYAEAVKALATAVAILAGSLVALALVDSKKLWSAVGALAVVIGVFAGLAAIVGKSGGIGDVEFGKITLSIIGLSLAVFIMARSLAKISKIPVEKYEQSLLAFIAVIGGLLLMGNILAKNGQNFVNTAGPIMAISGSILVMAIALKMLSKVDPTTIKTAGLIILGFVAVIVGLMAATKLIGDNADKIALTIGKIGLAFLAMALTVKILGGMRPTEAARGMEIVTVFAGIIIGLMAATKLISGSKNVDKIGGAILAVSGAMILMALTVKLMSKLDVGAMAKGIAAVTVFGGIIIGLMWATQGLTGSKNITKIGKAILLVSVAIGMLGITAAILSLIDVKSLIKGVAAVTWLAVLIGALIAVTKFSKNVMGTMIAIVAGLAVLVLAVGLLSLIKPEKLAASVGAITMVLSAFGLVMLAASSLKKSWQAMTALTGCIVALSVVLIWLSYMPFQQTLAAGAALSMVLLSMSAALVIVSAIGPMAKTGIVTMGLLALVMAGMAGILIAMNKFKVGNAIQNAAALSIMLVAMSGALILLGVVGVMGPAAFIGIGALATLVVAVLGLMIGIGALMEKVPAVQSFLKTGISTLVQLASGLGEMIGAFVGGIMTKISSTLPTIANDLSLFMTGLSPFIAGAKQIDASVLAGIGIISAAIIALTAAELINGIGSFLSGGTSFAQLGTELSMFMINALPFIMTSKMVDPAIMTGIKNLAEAILILTSANVLDGMTSWFTGGNAITNFGDQLASLGTYLNKFVTNLGTFTDAQVKTVDCAGRAIKALAEAADQIPNEGGWVGKILGENSIATFGSYLPGLGTNLNQFITNLGSFGEDSVATVDCAGRAILSLAQAAKEIPAEGGLWQKIVGEKSLASFAGDLPGLGTNLNQFMTNLGAFGEDKIATVNCAGNAIKALADAAKNVPAEGGLWQRIVGENSLATFGERLPQLATDLATFVSNLGTFSTTQVNSVTAACETLKAVATLGEIDIDDTSEGLKDLGTKLVKFASKLKTFAEDMGEVAAEDITTAISKVQQIIDMASNVANIGVDTLNTFGSSLKSLAKDGVKGFVDELTGEKAKTDAQTAGETLLKEVVNGIKDNKADLKDEFVLVTESAIDAASSKTIIDKAWGAGCDLVNGFIAGIKDNTWFAEQAAAALGKNALSAAKEAIDSNSPSKEAMKIGNYFGQGLVIGIDEYSSRSYDAGYGIAEKAKTGLSRAISAVSSLINNGIDDELTIRPVLDLSEVQSGASQLNSMFNTGPSIGVTSNLNAISSGVTARLQNGSNDDVVSAIDKLRNDISNIGGNTYNVNGITYDDGSNVTNAVEAIVRAARIERRV